eukprot:TRINITY_DN5269_c0_g1_i2.p1 TRINITY_DN5269_c0_g1~~TRINITY_DN5269_c0_g1_i2.p1  ORF type:complete len:233 (+),score=62.74 TRINITY_DN5269_c0_g1_i2:281-979(+)
MYSHTLSRNTLLRLRRRNNCTSPWYLFFLLCVIASCLVSIALFPPYAQLPMGSREPPRSSPAVSPLHAPRIRLHTPYGDIAIALLTEAAPHTSAHFVALARSGVLSTFSFYRAEDNTFYEPATAFYSLIQGGALGADKKPVSVSSPELDVIEAAHPNSKWTVGVARAAGSNGNTEFYINTSDNSALFEGLAVFGEVVEGREVVLRIQKGAVETQPLMHMLSSYVPITATVDE